MRCCTVILVGSLTSCVEVSLTQVNGSEDTKTSTEQSEEPKASTEAQANVGESVEAKQKQDNE